MLFKGSKIHVNLTLDGDLKGWLDSQENLSKSISELIKKSTTSVLLSTTESITSEIDELETEKEVINEKIKFLHERLRILSEEDKQKQREIELEIKKRKKAEDEDDRPSIESILKVEGIDKIFSEIGDLDKKGIWKIISKTPKLLDASASPRTLLKAKEEFDANAD